jgi:hypothetical protein
MQTRPIRTHVNTSNRTDAQEIRFLDPSALRAPKRNVRVHSKKQIDQIANSILRFGWTYPILIDEHGNVICGNGRLFASQKLGLREVPTITMSGLSETEMRALALADNKIAAIRNGTVRSLRLSWENWPPSSPRLISRSRHGLLTLRNSMDSLADLETGDPPKP